jgi:hypothetical protein
MPRALSTQRAVSLSILGLAIAGLCVDRMLLSGEATTPEPAAADLLVATESGSSRPETPSVEGQREPVPTVSREAARMAELSNTLRTMGVASESLQVLPEAFDVARPVVAERTVEAALPPPPLADPPMVTAVLSGMLPQAIAGGRAVAIGDLVDGWRVVDLGPGRVLFEQDGRRFERVVAQPDLGAFAPRAVANRPIAAPKSIRRASATGCSHPN